MHGDKHKWPQNRLRLVPETFFKGARSRPRTVCVTVCNCVALELRMLRIPFKTSVVTNTASICTVYGKGYQLLCSRPSIKRGPFDVTSSSKAHRAAECHASNLSGPVHICTWSSPVDHRHSQPCSSSWPRTLSIEPIKNWKLVFEQEETDCAEIFIKS